MGLVGGIQMARLIHRIIAFCYIAGILAMFSFGDFRHHWFKAAFRWTDADRQNIKAFPKELFGMRAIYPPQDKYTGVEKIYSLLTIFGSILVILSGIVMWVGSPLPINLIRWDYPVHNLSVPWNTYAYSVC